MIERRKNTKIRIKSARETLYTWKERRCKSRGYDNSSPLVPNSQIMLTHLNPGRGYRKNNTDVIIF